MNAHLLCTGEIMEKERNKNGHLAELCCKCKSHACNVNFSFINVRSTHQFTENKQLRTV